MDSYIPRKLPVIALTCTLFITYPNIIWIPWNLERLSNGEEPGFWCFFVFRIIYFYVLFHLQLRFNVRKVSHASFITRFCKNFIYTTVGCTVFIGLSYGLPQAGIQTGYVGNILLFQFFVVCLLCTFIGYISAMYDERRRKELEIEQLQIENLRSQCKALSGQINPHFFFNSLNGISSLVRNGEEEKTLLYVTKLSDIFRYILQSNKRELVTLGEELDFIHSFLHVMEVRFANKLTCSICVPEDKHNLTLPVLSLLPLIENVVIHNRIDSEHKMNIRISLSEGNELEISNPIYPKLFPSDTHGIGLQNLRNRFNLMMGTEIRIETGEDTFCVCLPLQQRTTHA
ncbi:MAG: histidine kinase [Bacteroides sp.]|nr:histidine kinase [Roseburia sp.]MCM1346241.1 histidine kinase [Bacteroides sp.]MCM1419841.1 histidine kinase [Bacteroides sp.]